MNMNKALQNLYHAVSNETTTKVNISKLLVDIHYAITGKESANKNNWSKIVNSMADNWPEGGGGSSDFSTANVTMIGGVSLSASRIMLAEETGAPFDFLMTLAGEPFETDTTIVTALYKGRAIINVASLQFGKTITVSGDIENMEEDIYIVTGDCTITIS